MLFLELGILHPQLGDMVGIDAVCASRDAIAIAPEGAVPDYNGAGGIIPGQDAVIIIDETAVLHGERRAFGANA
jgi:hypothetical protein